MTKKKFNRILNVLDCVGLISVFIVTIIYYSNTNNYFGSLSTTTTTMFLVSINAFTENCAFSNKSNQLHKIKSVHLFFTCSSWCFSLFIFFSRSLSLFSIFLHYYKHVWYRKKQQPRVHPVYICLKIYLYCTDVKYFSIFCSQTILFIIVAVVVVLYQCFSFLFKWHFQLYSNIEWILLFICFQTHWLKIYGLGVYECEII